MMDDQIILALDASSTNIGWCLAQGTRYLSSGVFHVKGKRDNRVRIIAQWTAGMLDVHDPDLVAIEEPTGSHQNLATDRLLARVCGNVEGVCTNSGVSVEWIHAQKVKKTGFCKNKLWQTARLVGKPSIGPDEADAIGIWQAALVKFRDCEFMNLIAQEVQP
jgi:Holliday junction resolvasome RuvABC endonuclease subunit